MNDYKVDMVTSTTGTSISSYMAWLRTQLNVIPDGKVSIEFTLYHGQVVDVVQKVATDRHEAVKKEHIPMRKKGMENTLTN